MIGRRTMSQAGVYSQYEMQDDLESEEESTRRVREADDLRISSRI